MFGIILSYTRNEARSSNFDWASLSFIYPNFPYPRASIALVYVKNQYFKRSRGECVFFSLHFTKQSTYSRAYQQKCPQCPSNNTNAHFDLFEFI